MKRLIVLMVCSVVVAAQQGPCGCSSDETCCKDDAGYSCCVDVETFCVQKTSPQYPSRCCPNWTVGCQAGSVGCCDPARPWQRALGSSTPVPPSTSATATTVNSTMYAIFTAGLNIHLEALTIEPSGATKRLSITGPALEWYTTLYGEGTRVFPFDARRNLFHFVEGTRNTSITLYTVDPKTGSSTSRVLSVKGYPLSFSYHYESDSLLFTVLENSVYQFYTVNMTTNSVARMGVLQRGGSEEDAGYYGGYVSGISLDGKTVQRLGYKTVTTGTGSGVGMYNVTKGGDATWTALGNPEGCEFYFTWTRKMHSEELISLAPSATGSRSFKVVRWNVGGQSQVVATLENAHSPSTLGIDLGYIAAAQAGNTYAGMVLEDHGASHKWAVLTMDLATNTAVVNTLNPEFTISGGSGISGFGVSL
eukprot:TRINITY_DN27228_c0_g1_i1.p1 TRINITY_DN27228_c0_g1~~TRINITY_DN27228_c0_g1_i1.p1  ORF type:complete len:433 (+),score=68.02 TRINITY_DN27228_c0_g1_i1:42-1301(+)